MNGDGTGSTCIYGTKTFADENFTRKHTEAGLLSMAVRPPPVLLLIIRDVLTRGIERRAERQRVAVLHHHGADAVPRWEARGVWEGGGRHGCGPEDGADEDGV